jgi:starch phosphorylase
VRWFWRARGDCGRTGNADSYDSEEGDEVMVANTTAGADSKKAAPNAAAILEQYGCGPIQFSGTADALYERHLMFDDVVSPAEVGPRERYEAVAHSVRDLLSQRWHRTEQTYNRTNPKRVYYLSMEFLIGRSLANNVMNLRLDPLVGQVIHEKQLDEMAILEEEPDAGLGNGGLGRLAACFLDSMATLQLPAMGYGLRYEYGIFKQAIQNGWQTEQPDNWLRHPDPWEIPRPNETVEIKLGCSFEAREGNLSVVADRPSTLLGVPFDRPVVGFGGRNINTLRLWAAATPDVFDFQAFSAGAFVGALAERLAAESVTRVLYPDDSTSMGQGLRFVQEYFLVACSLADLVRRFRRDNADWSQFASKVAIQLNDTHPSLAVPELMRVLLDDAGLGWDQALEITRQTLAYTNHTLLPEALEKWPLRWFELLLPRHLEIILELNRNLLNEVRARFPEDEERVRRVSLVEEDGGRKIRMANLAVVGSHSTNGVSAIHSRLLRDTTMRDLAELFPQRFNNKTNGVTPRRWLLMANPALAAVITKAVGDGWITDLAELSKLRPLAEDQGVREGVRRAKREAKLRFTEWLKSSSGVGVDPDTIFDCQLKRIHEYKRQLMNGLRIVTLFNRLRENPGLEMAPRTFFFSGKAAPAYRAAKLIIKFLNNLAAAIDEDPAVDGRLKVVFLPEYNVSLAERLIPASDVSNQISTAGYEASGTSNMKFMMNGALTLGTRDGATIEMAQAAGEENFFLFGLEAEQVAASRGWYNPQWHYDNDPETRKTLELIFSGYFTRKEPEILEPLRELLLTHGDYFMNLADLTSYLEADRQLLELYGFPEDWARKAVLNIASSGGFSSDRTIAEYANEIWGARACAVP